MHPRLFTIGPFTIYSFGLMMALGFITASFVMSREAQRKNLLAEFTVETVAFLRFAVLSFTGLFVITYVAQYGTQKLFAELGSGSYAHVAIVAGAILLYAIMPKLFSSKSAADTSTLIVMIALVAGLGGSKILYLVENWSDFAVRPFDMLFDPGGLTWYGGFLLATGLIYFYTRRREIPFLKMCDAAAPALIIGYGIARVGCHLAGDGDYGMPTSLPWGMVYSQGTYPPSAAFRNFPDIVQKYGVNGVVPDTIPVHPAPLYELIMSVLVFSILWKMRKKLVVDGKLFMLYLILAGAERFGIEFIRLNPRILLGLTEAQIIAAVLILAGLIGLRILPKKSTAPAIPG